jgi:lysophospholipase L1-like esterase
MNRAPQLVAAALAVVLSAPGVAAADSPSSGKDTTYYISIGDSLAAGYQPDVDKDTNVAYTDQLYKQLKQRQPGLKHIRLGCDGETTASLIKGGACHYPNAQSQLDAALKALAEHRGHVSYVTIDIGANDILRCVDKAGAIDQKCVNSATQALPENLARITQALRQAGTPGTQYVGSTYYNPLLAQWLRGEAGQQSVKSSVSLIKSANAAISQVYSAAGFKVADVAGAFSTDDFTPVNVPGSSEPLPTNVAKICRLTWACTKQDVHANALGHQVIAGAFAAVLPVGLAETGRHTGRHCH